MISSHEVDMVRTKQTDHSHSELDSEPLAAGKIIANSKQILNQVQDDDKVQM